MQIQTETQNEKAESTGTSERIPKRVWLAAGLALIGAILTAAVAMVNETPGGGSGQMWSVAAPCLSLAGMMAIVCYAVVRYH